MRPGIDIDADELIGLRWQARPFALTSRRPVASAVSGLHASRFRGRGVDYLESRNYQPGDDIRNMDWRVTARTGRAHTKIYQEERERPVILMLDLNGSLFFGTRVRLKSVAAAQAAALLAWATTLSGDRIGALAFADGDMHEMRPTGGRKGALALIRALCAWYAPVPRPVASSGLGDALERARRVVRPGSMLVLISDFYSADPTAERHLMRLREHNDVLALRLLDPMEQAPPPPGRYPITDGERHGLLRTASRQRREQYRQWAHERQQAIDQMFIRRGVPVVDLRNDASVVDQLAGGLRAVVRGLAAA